MNVPDIDSSYLASGATVAIRPLASSDINDRYLSWMNDKEVTRYLDSTGPYTLADLQAYFHRYADAQDSLMFAIEYRSTRLHIGNVKLQPIDRTSRSAVLGLLVGDKEFWGRGICEEASRLVVDYAFRTLGLKKIELGAYADHRAAVRCYEKVGFKVTKGYQRPTAKHRLNADAVWMTLVRDHGGD